MEHLRLLAGIGAATTGLALLSGLYQPWVVLWWRDRQNRLMVLRLYGTAFIFFMLLGIWIW